MSTCIAAIMPDPGTKIPYKMAEISARRFVQDAVPHSLGLLRNHKTNIEKSLALHDWEKIQREELNASRVIKELKNLLLEMEELRDRVRTEDVGKFDSVTNGARQDAIECIQEFVELKLRSPSKSSARSSYYDDPLSQDVMIIEAGIPTLQSDFQLNSSQLRARENVLRECETLRQEVEDLHGMFYNLNGQVMEQAEAVTMVHDNVEEAEEQVREGAGQLQKALRYKKAMYPLCGALLGSCVGGPVGLIAGLKAGGIAAFGCGVLGFTGGTVLKRKEELTEGASGSGEEMPAEASPLSERPVDVHKED